MTRRFAGLGLLILAGGLAAPGSLRADPTNPAPDFKEVYQLLRAHLPGATDASLNRAAVAGLVSQFPDDVVLVDSPAAGNGGGADRKGLDQAAVIEDNVVYWRVSRVAAGVADELAAAGRTLTATNKIAGAVLDLRFAGGEDYGAAGEAAGLLAGKRNARPVAGPLVVLMNGRTRGAAEILIAALRAAGTGLSIGSPTAGAARTFQEFRLQDGGRLLIATTPVKVEGKAIPADGLKPDIAMAVNADDEHAFWKNPYTAPAPDAVRVAAATNSFLPSVDHTSEADLVRQLQRDGRLMNSNPPPGPLRGPVRIRSEGSENEEEAAPDRAARGSRPVLRDPVLLRAVDLVKALAVMQGGRP